MTKIKVRPLEFDKYTVYKPLEDIYEDLIDIRKVTINGVKITEIEKYNVVDFVGKIEEEEECEIMFFPFNGDFLNNVLTMHKEVGEFIEIKHHLAFLKGERGITHVSKYGNNIVIMYTNLDELNRMFEAVMKSIKRVDLRTKEDKRMVKMKVQYKNWKLLYNENKVLFSRLEEYNTHLRD